MITKLETEPIHLLPSDEIPEEYYGVYIIASLDDERKVKLPVVWTDSEIPDDFEGISARIQSLFETSFNALHVVIDMLEKKDN